MAFYACIPDTDFPAGAADLVNLKKGQAWCGVLGYAATVNPLNP